MTKKKIYSPPSVRATQIQGNLFSPASGTLNAKRQTVDDGGWSKQYWGIADDDDPSDDESRALVESKIFD